MSNIKNVVEKLLEPDKTLCKVLIDFYETMKILESDKERAGKQATKIVMAVNDLKNILY